VGTAWFGQIRGGPAGRVDQPPGTRPSRSPRPRPAATGDLRAGSAVRDIWLLRLQALVVRAHGDDTAYRDYRDHYRAMATELGFEGHIAWAEAMP
jgi:hypothetical protein